MAITTTQKNHLNKMNKAAKDVSLGDIVYTMTAGSPVTAGMTTVGNTEISASKVVITPGLSAITTYQVQLFRSGSIISASGIYTEVSGSKLSVIPKTSGSWTPVAGDQVSWFVS